MDELETIILSEISHKRKIYCMVSPIGRIVFFNKLNSYKQRVEWMVAINSIDPFYL